jgi:hypothetical protein
MPAAATGDTKFSRTMYLLGFTPSLRDLFLSGGARSFMAH